MTARSDLDLIVVYDFDEAHPDSDGPRPLHAAPYFARFTQRLVNALTTRTNYGRLYDVDMRLRPSGRSGPVATSIAAFSDYQHNEAWTWEHMALTRARVASASSPALAARIVERDPRRAVQPARPRHGGRRRRGDAQGGRRGEGRRQPAGTSSTPPAGSSTSSSSRNISSSSTRSASPGFSIPRRGACWSGRRGSEFCRVEDAEVLRPAERLYQDLGQILRLCLSGPFDPKSAGGSLAEPARARRRRAGFPGPRRPSRRDPGARAQALREHPRQRAVRAHLFDVGIVLVRRRR